MGIEILRGPAEKTEQQDLATGSVRGPALAPASVSDLTIRPDSIQTWHIRPHAVMREAIAPDAVGEAELAAISIEAEKFIRSSNYDPGEEGWAIDGDGNAEFNDVTVRGVVDGSTVLGSAFSTGSDPSSSGSTNFGSDTAGSDPSGWTVSEGSMSTVQVVADATAEGGKRLQFLNGDNSTVQHNVAYWSDLGEHRDAEVLVKMRYTSGDIQNATPARLPGVFIRGTGGASRTGFSYRASIQPLSTGGVSLYLHKIDLSTVTLLDSQLMSIGPAPRFSGGLALNEDFYIRVRAIGTSLWAKAWKASEFEPSSWQVAASDSAWTSGFAVLGTRGMETAAPDFEVDTVEVANMTGLFNVSQDGTLWVGDTDSASAPFRVQNTGAVRANSLQIGSDGTAFGKMHIFTVNFDPPNIAAATAASWDITVSGIAEGDTIVASAGLQNGGGVSFQAVRAPSANTVRVHVYNAGSSAINLVSRDFMFVAFRAA